MLRPTVVSLFLPLFLAGCHLLRTVRADPCIAMDASFNLLVFGVDGKDWNAGTQDSWTSGSATDITASNRPPFDGANTTCYLAQFYNAVYVLNGDASDASAVYIYDAGAKSWSKQSVQTSASDGGKALDTSDFVAILDHDTNVFYAMSKGEMFFLDMGSMTTANSSVIAWTDVGAPGAWGDLSAYEPTMALAQNHIHFIGVPGLQPGQADIFVIHFSFFQPEAQSYGSDFPQTHGRTASFFQNDGVQQEFAFIPDDGSATYVINVENNSTQKLAAPGVKDPGAQYFAGVTSLVQLSSEQGDLQFLPYTQGSDNSGASWTKITALSVPAESGSGSSSSSNSSSTASGRGTSTASGASSSSSTGASSDAMSITVGAADLRRAVMMAALGGVALVALLL